MDSDDPWSLRDGGNEERYCEGEENYPGWGRTSPDAVFDGASGVFRDGQLIFPLTRLPDSDVQYS